MALPPSPISGDAGVVPPPGPMAGAAPDDMGGDDAGEGEDTVVATILKTSDGKLKLVAGDEPEQGGDMPPGAPGEAAGGGMPAPEPQTFDSPGQLMQALMPLLDEGTKGAEASFAAGFKGEPDATAAKPDMPMPG